MSLAHVLSGGLSVLAIMLFMINMPSAGFIALFAGPAIELVVAAITGKQSNI